MLFNLPNKVVKIWAFFLVLAGGFLLGVNYGILITQNRTVKTTVQASISQEEYSKVEEKVLPAEGFTLPLTWGDIGPKLISWGVIDEEKFKKLVSPTAEQEEILTKGGETPITINYQNSQFVVDMLWAAGLAQKSIVYTQGPMGTDYKKDVGNFSSTAGWTLAKGDAVGHLGKHELVSSNESDQRRVVEIAKNVFRPCCGNSTYFPDCNHGMAALAAIELMIAKGMSDEEIYKNVLKLNSFWFPQTYLVNAVYFEKQGVSWDKVDAKLVLGAAYSSASGAADISKKVGPLPGQNSGGGGCGA